MPQRLFCVADNTICNGVVEADPGFGFRVSLHTLKCSVKSSLRVGCMYLGNICTGNIAFVPAPSTFMHEAAHRKAAFICVHGRHSSTWLQAFTNYTSKVDQNLADQVVYRVWLVAKDSLNNEQTALSSVTVTTVRTTPPAFQELLVEYNAPSSVYVEVSAPHMPNGQSTSCHSMLVLQRRV